MRAYSALRMSNSTPSACRPEMSRRPIMKSERASPTTSTARTISFSALRSLPFTACASPAPVRNAVANCAACERTASTIETTSDHRYGRRNPSRRTNVRL